ncbi:hypothetical protein P4393_12245 [Bacillus subtilis]|nr:hypothetical protein [Bacillus subtilis]MED3474597.1 hypothetical protein [Bacillus subtilis]
MRELELLLLKMWAENGVEEVYKYKNRIQDFREPLNNIELFYDLSHGKAFADIEDIANHRDSMPEDYKVNVQVLIENRFK